MDAEIETEYRLTIMIDVNRQVLIMDWPTLALLCYDAYKALLLRMTLPKIYKLYTLYYTILTR